MSAESPARRRPARRRPRRRTLLLVVLAVAVVGALALVASWVRPSVDPGGNRVAGGDARVGTAYAFDGVVCLGSGQLGATVRSVEVEQVDGATVRLVRPPEDAPPTLGFPVEQDDGAPLDGIRVPAGEQDCVTRLLVVPDREGTVAPGRVRVTYGYGPGGVLRRTASLRPDVALEVTGTGTDPRLRGP